MLVVLRTFTEILSVPERQNRADWWNKVSILSCYTTIR